MKIELSEAYWWLKIVLFDAVLILNIFWSASHESLKQAQIIWCTKTWTWILKFLIPVTEGKFTGNCFPRLIFIFRAFQDGYISFKEFIRALSITSRGSLDEKLECKYNSKTRVKYICVFKIYVYLGGNKFWKYNFCVKNIFRCSV